MNLWNVEDTRKQRQPLPVFLGRDACVLSYPELTNEDSSHTCNAASKEAKTLESLSVPDFIITLDLKVMMEFCHLR